jgi:hypothetical protein
VNNEWVVHGVATGKACAWSARISFRGTILTVTSGCAVAVVLMSASMTRDCSVKDEQRRAAILLIAEVNSSSN